MNLFVCLYVTLFLKPLYTTIYTLYRYAYEISNLLNKIIRFFFFKSRLCSYQFHFITAKIYNLFHTIFFQKSSLFLCKSWFSTISYGRFVLVYRETKGSLLLLIWIDEKYCKLLGKIFCLRLFSQFHTKISRVFPT